MFLHEVVLCTDVSINSGKDLGQHRPSVWSAWYGTWQLYQGTSLYMLSFYFYILPWSMIS